MKIKYYKISRSAEIDKTGKLHTHFYKIEGDNLFYKLENDKLYVMNVVWNNSIKVSMEWVRSYHLNTERLRYNCKSMGYVLKKMTEEEMFLEML